MTPPDVLFDMLLRVVTAVILGAAIGLERQWRLRTAGIRTNALVAVGAALFVIVGAVGLGNDAGADPTRVAAQVVSGIGFLGAGIILRDGLNIRGLTTAATLWCAAAIGSLAGAGLEEMALLGCLAIIGTNILLRPLSRALSRRVGQVGAGLEPSDDPDDLDDYVLEVVTTEKSESRVRALVLQATDRPEYTLRSVRTGAAKNSRIKVIADISTPRGDTSGLELAMQRISLDPKVISSKWWPVDTE